MRLQLPSLTQFNRDTRLLIISTGIASGGYFGIQKLLEVLYVLRLGYGPEYVGLFIASGSLAFMGMSLPAGALGRRLGARVAILLGGVVATMGMASMPLAEFMPADARPLWPIGSRVLMQFGWSMFYTNMVTALAATTTVQTRGDVYALNGVLQGTGTLVGNLVAGVLPGLFAYALHTTVAVPGPYRLALWIGAVLNLIALAPVSMIDGLQAAPPRKPSTQRESLPVVMMALIFIYACLYNGGSATWTGFCNAYMDSDLHLPTSAIGVITGAAQFLAISAPLLIAGIRSRLGNGWILVLTSLATGLSLAPVGLVHHWAVAAQARLFTLALAAIWLPALQAFQMEMVGPERWSVASGALSMAISLGFGIVTGVGGRIVTMMGYGSLFLIGAGLTAVSALPMWGAIRADS